MTHPPAWALRRVWSAVAATRDARELDVPVISRKTGLRRHLVRQCLRHGLDSGELEAHLRRTARDVGPEGEPRR